jgi:ribosome-binding factor A
MEFTRSQQVEKLLLHEIAQILPDFFSSKRYGMLTVVGVDCAKNFDSARVRVSVLRNSHQFDEDARKAVGGIQQAINKKLVMKKIPKLIFDLDKTADLIDKIANL